MASRTTLLFFALLLIIVILVSIHESEAKRARSRRATRRKGLKEKPKKINRAPPPKTFYRSRRATRTKGQKGKPKKTNRAPPPKRFYSSVTYSQTRRKKLSFNDRFKSAKFGVLVYVVATSPIYSRRYLPYHDSSNIVIPKHRALKIKGENYSVETNEGISCPRNVTLNDYDPKKIINVTTKVSYKTAEHVVGEIKNIPSIENTDPKQTNLTLSADAIENYVIKIEIRVSFNESILKPVNAKSKMNLTNCTVLVYESEAYVVELSFASKNKAGFLLFSFALLVNLILS